MEQEVLNLANKYVEQTISNALNYLKQISSTNRSVRCRSSSNNRNNKKLSFHNSIPRCSLPATKNDLIHFQSRLLSYQQTNQTYYRTLQNLNKYDLNRTYDIQYSFSLNKLWLTKITKQRHNLISIQNFVNELIEHSIRTALLQIDYQNLINIHILTDDIKPSCLLFDFNTSYKPTEHRQIINSYIDQFIHSTIKQAIENISSANIEFFSNHLTENIINSALLLITNEEVYSPSILTDDETYPQVIRKKSIQLENIEQQQQSNLFNQIEYYPSSVFRLLINSNGSKEESIDSLVNNIAQQIYIDSFDELRQIFTEEDINNK